MKYKIKDLCEVTSSRRIFASEYVKSGVPFYRGKEIVELSFGKKISTDLFITHKRFEEIAKTNNVPECGDILMTAVGTLGVLYYVDNPNFYFKDGNLMWFRDFKNNCISKYIFYLLSTPKIKQSLLGNAIGSTQRAFTIDMVKSFEVDLPNKYIQQHIVDTIGSVDDLIKKNVEFFSKFQQILCDEYKKIVLKIDTSDKLKNHIKKSGVPLKNDEWLNSTVIDLSTMPQNEIVITTSSNGADFSTNIKTLEPNSLLYGSIRPYFKKCGFTIDEKFVAGTVHSFNVINNDYYLWILGTICSDDFHKYTEINSQGTKMPIINWDSFGNYDMPIPNSGDLKIFNKIIEPIYLSVLSKIKENKKLENIKSQLLQKYFG